MKENENYDREEAKKKASKIKGKGHRTNFRRRKDDKNVRETYDILGEMEGKRRDEVLTRSVAGRRSYEDLKASMSDFFRAYAKELGKKDDLQELIEEKLRMMIQSDELSFNDLMKLFNSINITKNKSRDSFIEIFKPTSNNTSVIADILVDGDKGRLKDEYERIYDRLSPAELEKLDSLMRGDIEEE